MSSDLPVAGANRHRVVVRNAADINRLSLRLLTRWTLPKIEIRTDALPPLVGQFAQHRIVRLAEAHNLLGEIAGIAILLGGSYYAWMLVNGWRLLGFVAVAAFFAVLLGKGIKATWTRARLLGVLQQLRRQLVAAEISGAASSQIAKAMPRQYMGCNVPKLAVNTHAAAMDHDAEPGHLPHYTLPDLSDQTRVLLSHAADVDRLVLHLLTHWKPPRVEIRADELPALEVQRAQHRLVHLSEACNCVLGGVLAGVTLMLGTFYAIWAPAQKWVWTDSAGWGLLGGVIVLTLGAALMGTAIEVAWTRFRLLQTLRQLRSRLGAVACGT